MSIVNHFLHLDIGSDQERTLRMLENYLNGSSSIFILKGYAGTGKTTILKGLVSYLNEIGRECVLMAPTGRAANVLKNKTGFSAQTIHRTIYSFEDVVEEEDGDSFYYHFKIRESFNPVNKVYIVDEASMVSDLPAQSEFFRFGSGCLLTDLIEYSRVQNPAVNAKLIFVGDPCQLPPVTDNFSKALDTTYLKDKFRLTSEEVELKEVFRQRGESGLMEAATRFRKSITAGVFNDFNLRSNDRDVLGLEYGNLMETWEKGPGSKIIIASKNRTCQAINRQIRHRIHGQADLPIQKGDCVIISGNNSLKNVFNGEFAVVNEAGVSTISRSVPLKGKPLVTLTWRDVELVTWDGQGGSNVIRGKLLENYLQGRSQLKPDEFQALYVDFINRHLQLKPKSSEFAQMLKNDEYFNCLILKYGYAVTCHKAQGGEWDTVFTIWDHDVTADFNCFTDKQRRAGKTNEQFYRWAYTAVTRASGKLYALNPPAFTPNSNMTFVDPVALKTLQDMSGVKAMAKEVVLDERLQRRLAELKLTDQPSLVQDHFFRVMIAAEERDIELTKWDRIGYEIRYTFRRGNEQAVFKSFINGKGEFRNPFLPIPTQSPNSLFNETIQAILLHLPELRISRAAEPSVQKNLEFQDEWEESFPFTRTLFNDIVYLLEGTGITVDALEHLQFAERYTFKRGPETAVLDFEYKKEGQFGRILPIPGRTNSAELINSLRTILRKLYSEDNAN
jgi:tRNA A37 threonylcarbamoyladenosine biosynthesis protein TsaE